MPPRRSWYETRLATNKTFHIGIIMANVSMLKRETKNIFFVRECQLSDIISKRPSWLPHRRGAVHGDARRDRLLLARWPNDVDTIRGRRGSKAKVEWHGALREITGLAVHRLDIFRTASADRDDRTKAVSVGLGTD